MRTMTRLTLTFAAAATLATALATTLATTLAATAAIPPRPEDLKFAPLAFTPPEAKDYRHTLKDGTPVYMAPSKEFPLVTISMSFKGGSYLDPADSPGLASMTGSLMRSGGTTSLKPADLDEELDFLATRVGVQVRDTMSSATLNTLTSNLETSMDLFFDVVRNPGFDQGRLDVQKGEAIESMKQRNDSADSIIDREWSSMLYGSDHHEARQPTQASIEAITQDSLRAMHAKIFHPGNAIIAVSGDFDPSNMMARLDKAFEGWQRGSPNQDPPAPTVQVTPGVYHVAKDIPQGKVFIGLRGIKRDDPDFFPMLMMNDILGGGGFTSRIMQSVRSNEGLAYSAGSRSNANPWYPGEFRALFQSKNATVALALKLIDDEFHRIRRESVTEAELETAKNSFVETFPQNFASKEAMLGIFVSDEMTRRPDGYWQTFREKVMAVKPEDIQRVANKYLDPKKMAVMVVGNWDEIYQGNDRASMKDFFNGDVTHLPLRDPLTLEPIK
ncbi:MAG: pitrilysin family protein [Phycisphaerae bacterium]|nr:pitrilysin family protein [Phycisphaerae bacterium]